MRSWLHIGRTDSPIEAAFLDAFCTAAIEDGFDVARISTEPAFVITIESQRWLGLYRVDFLITYRYFGHVLRFVVECDGHEFHHATKVQVWRDNERDRKLNALGTPVYRFPGSMLTKFPEVCAREMLDLIINFQSRASDWLHRTAVKEARALRKAQRKAA